MVMGRVKRINLLTVSTGKQVNWVERAGDILKWVTVSAFILFALALAGLYVAIAYYGDQTADMNARREGLREEIDASNILKSQMKKYANDGTALDEHAALALDKSAFSDHVVMEVVNAENDINNAQGMVLNITAHTFGYNQRTQKNELVLGGSALNPEDPLTFTEALRSVRDFETVSLSGINTSSTAGDISFQVVCVLKGAAYEAE